MAEKEGYRLEFGCVSGDDFGAMGLHYVNDTLVDDGIVDATRPQIVLYEAMPNGGLKLTGADYLVIADAWDATHPGMPPELMGQIFHYFKSPNRFGLPAFYTLHVWAWKENPKGAFVNWHPNVSCQSFVGQTPLSQGYIDAPGQALSICLPDRRGCPHHSTTESKRREIKMSTAQVPALDMNKLNAFIGQFVTDLGAAVHTGMVVIGEKLGLYKALADGPMSSAQLAAKTKTDERYLREWLASQAAGGYITYDEKTGQVQPE